MINPVFEDPGHKIKMNNNMINTPHDFLYHILTDIKKGFSPIVAICGRQRSGKSFTGVWLSYVFYQAMKKEYDPTKTTFYDPEKVLSDLGGKMNEVIMCDEAADIMDYQEWRNKSHRAFRSMLNAQGFRNNLYIIISPHICQIDASIRVHIDYAILCLRRGHFKVWKFNKEYRALVTKEAIKKLKPFQSDVFINKSHVPDAIWDKYEKFSLEEKEKIRLSRIETFSSDRRRERDIADSLSRALKIAEIAEMKNRRIGIIDRRVGTINA